MRTLIFAATTFAVMAGGSAEAQKAGGTLRIYLRDNPPSASIQEESTISTVMPFMAVFNNLFVFDQHSKRNSPDALTPELATEWAWDDAGTKLTLKLRQGVKWHDGKPFTSADVKCTWDAILEKRESGWRKNPRQDSYANLKEVTVNGDYEVAFQLGRPQPSFMSLLASGFSPVYSCHVPAREMRTKPVGTGPFKVVDFRPNDYIKLARNADYWRPDRPYLDGIEWKIITNRSTRILAFIAGDFDLTFTQDVTIPLARDIASQKPDAVCELNPSGNQGQLLVNRAAPPFDNEKIRQAMMLSINRQAFIDIISEGKDRIGGAMLPPPEGSWGLTPEQLADLPGYGGDVEANREKGRRLMQELGYGPDKTLKIKVATRNLPLYRDPAVILIDHLKTVYIEGELDVVETSLWTSRMTKKDFSVAMNVSGIGIDDPDNVFIENYTCGAERNYANYCNRELEEKFREQSAIRDPEARRKLVHEIDRALQRDAARPIIFHTRANTCWQSYVKGISIAQNSQYNHWRMEDFWLDK